MNSFTVDCWVQSGCCCSVWLVKFGPVRLLICPVQSGPVVEWKDTSLVQISDFRSLESMLFRSGPVRSWVEHTAPILKDPWERVGKELDGKERCKKARKNPYKESRQ